MSGPADTSKAPSLAESLAAPGGHVAVLDRTAEDVMTPGVVVLPVTAPLDQAAHAMSSHRVHGVLVVSCEGRPCGWVTSEHITRHVGDSHLLDWAVDAIGETFVAVAPSTSVRDVMAKLQQPGVSHVAVQQRPEVMPLGVITELDIAAQPAHRASG